MNSFGQISTLTVVAIAYFCILQQNQVDAAADLTADVPKLKMFQTICRIKTLVSPKVYGEAMKNNMDIYDRKLQCYTKCMFRKMGTMDIFGKMSLEKFVAQLGQENKELVGDNMLSCQREVDDKDLCKKGMKLYQCFQNKGGPIFQFV